MSQRESGYARIEHDVYETPEWATMALVPHIPTRVQSIHEPAAGSGKMVGALTRARLGVSITRADIRDGEDFLAAQAIGADAIITNPPYSDAQRFIEHALHLTRETAGVVAMLLRCDYDHAKTRRHLFSEHPAFAKKIILTRRIRWIEDSTGSPSFNHSWYLWDWRRPAGAPPVLAYDFQGD